MRLGAAELSKLDDQIVATDRNIGRDRLVTIGINRLIRTRGQNKSVISAAWLQVTGSHVVLRPPRIGSKLQVGASILRFVREGGVEVVVQNRIDGSGFGV